MQINFIIFFFIWSIFNIIEGEYLIRNKIPSYLYYKINNIEDEIFPNDIRIIISLTRIDGDLLYSIDKNMNQLIVSVFDGIESTIKIQFRKKQHFVSIHKLCGCERCLYEIFDLRIQIREQIALQCNDREVEYTKYERNKEVNEGYPVIYSKNDKDNGLPNEAHLWLVNQEQYKDIYHNPQQMLGCIFNVFYDRNEIFFTRISDNVGGKCIKTCVGNICNGGKCYDTYNGKPVCDCTKTFLSGTYCNDTIISINGQSLSLRMFEVLKVAWKSSAKEILILNNVNVEIQLYIVDKHLCFQYKHIKGPETITKSIISKDYIPNREYILIITFLKTKIDIQSFNNEAILEINIPTYRDLTNEIFTSITLQSGDGYIDLSYKTSPREYIWHKVDIEQLKNVSYVPKTMSNDEKLVYQIKAELSKKDYKISRLEGIIKEGNFEKEKLISDFNIKIQDRNTNTHIAYITAIIILIIILLIIIFLKRKQCPKTNEYIKKRKQSSNKEKVQSSTYGTVKNV